MHTDRSLNRPRRHRVYAILWRLGGIVAATYAWVYGYGEILAALVLMGCGLVGASHDLIAATLRPKFIIFGAKDLAGKRAPLPDKLGADS